MYTNADLKPSQYVRVNIKTIPQSFLFLILEILELHTRKVCEVFFYNHTETMEYKN